MRVVRVYHGGRDGSHRERDRALVRAGVELTLVVPSGWPDGGAADVAATADEPFRVVELDVHRAGDVNRHRLRDPGALLRLVRDVRPDVLDLHEEPFSAVVHQVLRGVAAEQAVVLYTAQNLDKRFPPPFAQWERRALGRAQGLYPCSRQAASVAVGKGFTGALRVLPLAPAAGITPGPGTPPADELRLLLVGRLVPEKGVLDAVEVLAAAQADGPATLTLLGTGPEGARARSRAAELGVSASLHVRPWTDPAGLAEHLRRAHVLLVPSRSTRTWVEQFGRVVVEAQAAGAVVVGYACGALPEVVGAAGLLVPEGDVAALGRAVRSLRRDPGTWRALRDDGFRSVTTWDDVAAGQVELYGAAAAATGGTRAVHPARRAARAAHGPPAGGTDRPFALPLLRDDVPGTALLARWLDALGRRERADRPGPLRVVFLDHVAGLSGGELALLRLVAAVPQVRSHVVLAEDGPLRGRLEAAGATVELLTLDAGTRDTRRADVAGLAGARAAVGMAGHTLRLARRLHQLDPDLVHTNSLKSGFYGSVAARLARVPVVWHLRDRVAPDYLPARVVTLTRWALQNLPSAVLANSRETLRASGVRAGRRSVRAAVVLSDPYLPRRSPNPRTGAPVVTMVGRLAPWKGQEVLLRALADPALAGVHARVVGSAMFGEDDYAAGLGRLVQELGLVDRVELVGFTADVEAELARADVLVHASVLPEPFGQVVVEGMAAGLAVVATAAGGPAEIVTDGVDGLLVPPGDVDALVSVLQRLVTDGALRRRLGAAAVLRAADFRPEVLGPVLTAFYDDVLRNR